MKPQHQFTQSQFEVARLGPCERTSPLQLSTTPGDGRCDYTPDDMRILFEPRFRAGEPICPLSLEHAGARERIYFDPMEVKAAIVTCGGLSPGINNVVRTIVLELIHNYGVPEVWGIRYGYEGLNGKVGRPPIVLTPEVVENIHHRGGTILGTSRGPQLPADTVDFLTARGINMLFCIGGDGTQAGAHAMAQEVERRGLKIAVVGIPKTIDNDISFIDQSFGFQTAFSVAADSIHSAHAEAKASPNGIGLVKLMGRHSGFIACYAALARNDANFVLIPEVPFRLDGDNGFLAVLRRRVVRSGHAVVWWPRGPGRS